MRRISAILSIVATLAIVGQLLAHEGHVHEVMGTVAAVDAAHLEVSAKDGEKISILLSKDTKCFRGKAPVGVGEIKVGEKIVVSVTEEGDKKMAREVRLAEEHEAHPHH